jgi:hypothetical protein
MMVCRLPDQRASRPRETSMDHSARPRCRPGEPARWVPQQAVPETECRIHKPPWIGRSCENVVPLPDLLFAGKPLLALYAMNRMLWKILCTANRTSQKPELLGPAGIRADSWVGALCRLPALDAQSALWSWSVRSPEHARRSGHAGRRYAIGCYHSSPENSQNRPRRDPSRGVKASKIN